MVRISTAEWKGGLKGKGSMTVGKKVFTGEYSFSSRFESGKGTNPEELIGAAHAGCFSMALALALEGAGFKPESIRTTARVSVEKVGEGFKITAIDLETEGRVPGIGEATFAEKAEIAKKNCPVSVALAGGPEIRLTSRLATAKAA
ncbi:MAG: OsmC family protein [Nitrospiraceae bacterium]|nr:OsmC family protein [Nitrospiraceae bacterium]